MAGTHTRPPLGTIPNLPHVDPGSQPCVCANLVAMWRWPRRSHHAALFSLALASLRCARSRAVSTTKRGWQPAAPLLPTPRPLLLRLEYDGAAFSGSSRCPGRRTVQGELERAASKLTGEPDLRTRFASRTDAGVHARGAAAVVRTASPLDPAEFRRGLNQMLADDVRCARAAAVAGGGAVASFDPRADALAKHYRYALVGGAVAPALGRGAAWHVPARLDVGAMRTAAAHLSGRPLDFTSFASRSTTPSRHPICHLERLDVTERASWEEKDEEEEGGGGSARPADDRRQRVIIDVVGDRFLYKMVRAIVGCLVAVGRGELAPDDTRRLLEARSRDPNLNGAPAKGLCLQWVRYPEGTEEVPTHPGSRPCSSK